MISGNPVCDADCLFFVDTITRAMSPRVDDDRNAGATEPEVHVIGYLAALSNLWQTSSVSTELLSRGNDADDAAWPYQFFKTPRSEPFSPDLSAALRRAKLSAAIEDLGPTVRLTERGQAILGARVTTTLLGQRFAHLEAAANVAFLWPLPLLLNAVAIDPTLAQKASPQPLLDERSDGVLSPFRDAIGTLVGPEGTVMERLELWVSYLLQVRLRAVAA